MSKYTRPQPPRKETEEERIARFAQMAQDWRDGKLDRQTDYKPNHRRITDEDLDRLINLNN